MRPRVGRVPRRGSARHTRYRRGARYARRRGPGPGQRAEQRARSRLKAFRGGSILAIGLTALLLFTLSPDEVGADQEPTAAESAAVADTLPRIPDTVAVIREVPVEAIRQTTDSAAPADSSAEAATREATGTLQELWRGFVRNLPKYGIALGILVLAGILARLLRPTLRAVLRGWERSEALSALAIVVVWLLAFGIAISVLVGDIRALVGSVGLIGLALSWALQTPIESFTGWMLNSLRGYYRVGDRIAVAERNVYGDVYSIDLLTTTLWEFGGAERPGMPVRGEQATGRMVTFPNNEVLTGTIINYTRDFPFVWDELWVEFDPVESDPTYAVELGRRIAAEVVGEYMAAPASAYSGVLRARGLEPWVSEEPQVFLSVAEGGWLEMTIRYLVGARERRKWKSRLTERLLAELRRPEHAGKLKNAYPRQLVQFLDAEGRPVDPGEWGSGEG